MCWGHGYGFVIGSRDFHLHRFRLNLSLLIFVRELVEEVEAAAVRFFPTVPFPISIVKATRLIVLLFPRGIFIAARFVKACLEMKLWIEDCAVTALSRDFCCMIYSTATRAKSRTSSVTAKTAVGSLLIAELVAEAVAVGTVEVSTMILFVAVAEEAAAAEETDEGTIKKMVLLGTAVRRTFCVAEGVSVATGVTISFAFPLRVDKPSKVTRAFSDPQERFAVLKRAIRVSAVSGTEKLAAAVDIRRGMESPIVTLERLPSVVVVHPVAPTTLQVVPVNPFVHTHAHDPLSIRLKPPF